MVSKEMGKMLILACLSLLANVRGENWPCSHVIFCKPFSGLLHTVQTSNIFKDSKTFVDMPMKFSMNQTLTRFEALGPNPDATTLKKFVDDNFSEAGTELLDVNLSDWSANPAIIDRIKDANYRNLIETLHGRWQHLARKVSDQVGGERTSLIPLQYPFIVPGGRFREIYYWDSFWTIKGLLISELNTTVEGMLDNFQDLIKMYGHIPNGNRVYYEKRSQPPFFCQMVDDFIQAMSVTEPSKTRTLMARFIMSMQIEAEFWQKRFRNVTVSGVEYSLASYNVMVDGPRPESYKEDYELAEMLSENQRAEWYGHMKSGAESGWDYSSRWFSSPVNKDHPLLSVTTGDTLPVDLNSILYKNAEVLERYFTVLERPDEAQKYRLLKEQLKEAIRAVLWNEEDSMWFDFNIKTNKHNRNFYPSNLMPLYSGCYHSSMDPQRILENIVNSTAVDFPGGLPTSLYKSTEHPQQWDFPNVWPPLVEIFVTSMNELNLTDSRKIARDTAAKYINNVYQSAQQNGTMYEKYNCETVGRAGGGGEYGVQEGFGWSNGVAMSLLSSYPDLQSASCRIEMNSFVMIVGLILASAFSGHA